MAFAEDRFPSFEEIAEAMRPKPLRNEAFCLSREERDYVAGHVLDSIGACASTLVEIVKPGNELYAGQTGGSDNARKIATLSNLLGDIGWSREGPDYREGEPTIVLGELFPTAQLRPWLEQWLIQDADVAGKSEEAVERLGTGGLLLARLEKWTASHGN